MKRKEVYKNEKKVWCINGIYHRIDGPAYIEGDNYQEWWINNKEVEREEYIHENIKDCIYGI